MFDTFIRDTIISVFIHILFSSFIITLLTTLFNRKINKIINYIIYAFICIIFAFQFVMKNSMDSFMSLSMFSFADQAVDFLGAAFKIIFSNLYGIIICFLPLIFLIVFRKRIDFDIERKDVKLGEKLMQARKAAGLTQADIAAKLHVSRQAVSRWESGQSKPSTEKLLTLGNLYGISLDQLLSAEEPAVETVPDLPETTTAEPVIPETHRPRGSKCPRSWSNSR